MHCWSLKVIWENGENEELLWMVESYSHCIARQIVRGKVYVLHLVLPAETWYPHSRLHFVWGDFCTVPAELRNDIIREQHFTWKDREKLSLPCLSGYQSWGVMYACIIQCNLKNRAEGRFFSLGENGEGLFTFSCRKTVIMADDSSKFWDLGNAKALWSFA